MLDAIATIALSKAESILGAWTRRRRQKPPIIAVTLQGYEAYVGHPTESYLRVDFVISNFTRREWRLVQVKVSRLTLGRQYLLGLDGPINGQGIHCPKTASFGSFRVQLRAEQQAQIREAITESISEQSSPVANLGLTAELLFECKGKRMTVATERYVEYARLTVFSVEQNFDM